MAEEKNKPRSLYQIIRELSQESFDEFLDKIKRIEQEKKKDFIASKLEMNIKIQFLPINVYDITEALKDY